MLISLSVMSGVIALASYMATGQLRFFRGVGDAVALKGQLDQTGAIVASVLWGVSPAGGDIVVALDSAIEVHAAMGTAVVCASALARVSMPAPTPSGGNALSAFMEAPEPGDRLMALFADSIGATWLTLHVASPPVRGSDCPLFPSVSGGWTLALLEPVIIPAGASMRFTRPIRLSLYRASNTRWYLGARDWNGSAQRFNAIQPVAGPLSPFSVNPAETGLRFVYRDDVGNELETPADPRRIASVTVVSRAASFASIPSQRYQDSIAVTIALRNAR